VRLLGQRYDLTVRLAQDALRTHGSQIYAQQQLLAHGATPILSNDFGHRRLVEVSIGSETNPVFAYTLE
jgi:hypothetical protein